MTKRKDVKVMHGYIIIRENYNIALDRCDTYAKIISWCMHLSQKTWMTAPILHQFIDKACMAHNLNAWEHT